MNDRKPKLSWHKHKQTYFVKYNGEFHWLGKDEKTARAAYADHIVEWAKWRVVRTREIGAASSIPKGLTMAGLFQEFMQARAGEIRDKTISFYHASLRRFLGVHGKMPVSSFGAKLLTAFRTDLIALGLAKSTVNHEIGCIKTMLQWAMDMSMAPEMNLGAVKMLTLEPPEPKGYTIHQMRRLFCSVPTHVKPWIAVNWLTMARPTEVVRTANGSGVWEEKGIFRLLESKTSRRSRQAKRLVFSDLALKWFERMEPWTKREDSYYQATYRAGWTHGPHPLRHGAATHIQTLGVSRVETDLLLGHMPSRVSLIYAPVRWQSLRETASRITL